MSSPSVSIVIPTCNRSDYLLPMLDAILGRVSDVEIIVSDNSDTDALATRLAHLIASGRVIYQHIARPLSVVENFESAVNLARGHFVTCLGDDDCIGPGFNDVIAWALRVEADAVYSYSDRLIANYFWPGVKSFYFGSGYAAKLFVNPYDGEVEVIDPSAALRHAARSLGSGLGKMPRLYHGLVRRSLLDSIREKYGAIFGGVSPDIYSATLISLEAKRVFRVNAPFVLPGGSPVSTAGQGAARTDRADLYDVDHIRRFGPTLKWSPSVPAYYAPYNVWAYSMLCALQLAAPVGIRPNYASLILKAFSGDPKRSQEIRASSLVAVRSVGPLVFVADFITASVGEFKVLGRRVRMKLSRKNVSYSDLNDIGAAVDLLVACENARGFRLHAKLS